VVNGYEAVTGQINMEYRKPTAEVPHFVNLFLSQTLRTEANIASSLQLNDRLSTVVLAHASADPMEHDMNGDGFLDEPLTKQFNLANRWLYMTPNGTQLRFGTGDSTKIAGPDRKGSTGLNPGKNATMKCGDRGL
jgi:hypothetical protein